MISAPTTNPVAGTTVSCARSRSTIANWLPPMSSDRPVGSPSSGPLPSGTTGDEVVVVGVASGAVVATRVSVVNVASAVEMVVVVVPPAVPPPPEPSATLPTTAAPTSATTAVIMRPRAARGRSNFTSVPASDRSPPSSSNSVAALASCPRGVAQLGQYAALRPIRSPHALQRVTAWTSPDHPPPKRTTGSSSRGRVRRRLSHERGQLLGRADRQALDRERVVARDEGTRHRDATGALEAGTPRSDRRRIDRPQQPSTGRRPLRHAETPRRVASERSRAEIHSIVGTTAHDETTGRAIDHRRECVELQYPRAIGRQQRSGWPSPPDVDGPRRTSPLSMSITRY